MSSITVSKLLTAVKIEPHLNDILSFLAWSLSDNSVHILNSDFRYHFC